MLEIHDMIYEPKVEEPFMVFDVTLKEKSAITFFHAIMRSMVLLNFDTVATLGLDSSYTKESPLFDYPIGERFFIKVVPDNGGKLTWSSGMVVNGSYMKRL